MMQEQLLVVGIYITSRAACPCRHSLLATGGRSRGVKIVLDRIGHKGILALTTLVAIDSQAVSSRQEKGRWILQAEEGCKVTA